MCSAAKQKLRREKRASILFMSCQNFRQILGCEVHGKRIIFAILALANARHPEKALDLSVVSMDRLHEQLAKRRLRKFVDEELRPYADEWDEAGGLKCHWLQM